MLHIEYNVATKSEKLSLYSLVELFFGSRICDKSFGVCLLKEEHSVILIW
jgi:hypothetical protein